MKFFPITVVLALLLAGCVNVHVHFPQANPPAAEATTNSQDK